MEEPEKPLGSDHVGSEGLGPLSQLAVRCDECHFIRGVRDDVNEHVVPATSSMEDSHAVDDAGLGALASLAFENHDDRLGDLTRSNGICHFLHELSGCSGSVAPPPGRT